MERAQVHREYCEQEATRSSAEDPGLKGFEYLIGTMIELPRAALTADEIAPYAEFFSFGTNDLTQTTYGLSRDDSGMFLKDYIDAKIYERIRSRRLIRRRGPPDADRFEEGAVADRPDLKIGICGEHGGEPSSVDFCHRVGLDYVSCSPYRVPIARLAAAHAAIKTPRAAARSGGKAKAKAKGKPAKKRKR